MMRKWLSYCGFLLAALLLVLTSCTREESVEVPGGDGLVRIYFSTAELEVTRATIPGDAQAGDGGGFSDYYMNFIAPEAGTMKIWASSTDGSTQKLCILEGGVVTTENCTGTSKPSDGAAFTVGVADKGPVTIYPSDGVSRIYKITYTYEELGGATVVLTWDFGDVTFQGLLSNPLAVTILPPATSTPSMDADTPWMVTLDGLTIWSKTASHWVSGAGGYFQWGGYFNSNAELVPVDLVILIADNQEGSPTRGNIVATYPDSGRGGVVAGSMVSQSTVDAVISFNIAGKGEDWEYTVYAFGNTAGLWPMTTDGENTISNLTSLTTAAQVEALKFKAQTRNNTDWEPEDEADDDDPEDGVSDTYAALPDSEKYDDGVLLRAGGRLPVSAKSSLTVTAGGNGEAYLELLRCVAKVTAKIINNTGYPMNLYDYKHTVHGINPDQGWVIPHEDDVIGTAANLLANPCAKYSNDAMYIPISADGSKEYNWYVFPSTGPYLLCLQFTLDKYVDGKKKTYTYNHLPITNWRAQNIPALERNQHLTVTTRISKGLTVSFNFEVTTWAPEHNASVEFD